jgi:hypothetical protein
VCQNSSVLLQVPFESSRAPRNEEDSFVYVVAKTPLTQTVMSFEEFFFFSFPGKSSQSHFTQGFVSVKFLESCGVLVSPALEIMGMC